MNGRPWTTSEEALLRDCYTKGGCFGCQFVLDRSSRSIIQRAHKLGLVSPIHHKSVTYVRKQTASRSSTKV